MSKFLLQKIESVTSKCIELETYTSIDSEFVVTGSSDRNIRFLETNTLEEIARYEINRSVNCVSVCSMSLEGEDPLIVIGGKNSCIQVWNPTSGNLERNIDIPSSDVRAISTYRGSRTFVVVGTKDAKVILCDVQTSEVLTVFEGHRASVCDVSITSSIDITDIANQNDLSHICIVSGSVDRTARSWSMYRNKKLKKFRHQRTVCAVAVVYNNLRAMLATAGAESMIKLWDVETGILIRNMDGHKDKINTLSIWDGFQLLVVSGSVDATLRVYDLLSGECLCSLQGHSGSVLDCTICDEDNPKIVSCSSDRTVIQWDLQRIISEYYYTSGDKEGSRNDTPAHLPGLDAAGKSAVTYGHCRVASQKFSTCSESTDSVVDCTVQVCDTEVNAECNKNNINCVITESSYPETFQKPKESDEIRSNPNDKVEEHVMRAAESVQSRKSSSVAPIEGSNSTISAVTMDVPVVRRTSVQVVTNFMKKFSISRGSPEVSVVPSQSSNSLKSAAKTAQSNYNIAQVEQQLEVDRQRQQASAKLAQRLKQRKKGSAGSQIEDCGSESATEAELQVVKANKLRQHIMQEKRNRQSMLLAKNKAAEGLQKRLEDLISKKQLKAGASIREGNREDSSDSDDD